MAPSVQQIIEDVPYVAPEKLATAVAQGPKVKRQIEVEGGKTDAKVMDALPTC
jgi:hypothetical protein